MTAVSWFLAGVFSMLVLFNVYLWFWRRSLRRVREDMERLTKAFERWVEKL